MLIEQGKAIQNIEAKNFFSTIGRQQKINWPESRMKKECLCEVFNLLPDVK